MRRERTGGQVIRDRGRKKDWELGIQCLETMVFTSPLCVTGTTQQRGIRLEHYPELY